MATTIPFAQPPASLLPPSLSAANLNPAYALATRDSQAALPPDGLTLRRAEREGPAEQTPPRAAAEAAKEVVEVVEVELGGAPSPDLSSKTVRELRDVAAQRGVSLAGATNKKSILKRLQQTPEN